jgi:hypothetical protein
MALRITPMVIHSKQNHVTGPVAATGLDSTDGGFFSGSVIDRLALGQSFTHAQPFVFGEGLSNTGSTGGQKRVLLDIVLKHGDSSGGGDLTEVDTGLRVAQQINFTTNGTTGEYTYTTGTLRVQHSANPYPLRNCKRFLAPAGAVTRAGVVTSTAAGGLLTLTLGMNMLQSDEEPPARLGVFPAGSKASNTTTTTTTT